MMNSKTMRDGFIYAVRMIEVLESIPCLAKNRYYVRLHEIPAIISKLKFATPEVHLEFEKDMKLVTKIAEEYKGFKDTRKKHHKSSVTWEIYDVWMIDCVMDIGNIFMKWKNRYISITDLDFY